MTTLSEYNRAYGEWYCMTAKKPVSLEQYILIMGKFPEDIKTINRWLDEGRKPF